LESSGLDWLSSADAKLETAAMQPARNEIDLMMGSSQVTQSHVRFWMEIKVAWWCCWNVAHTRLLHSCSLRRSRWGTSVLGIAMQLKLHPTRPPRSYPHTTMVLLSKGPSRPQLYRLRTGLVCGAARRHLTNNGFFRVSEEVREALHSKKPVVALETTIYTHGRIPIK
jgi:hypothetical protein